MAGWHGAVPGRPRYERHPELTTHRNGSRAKRLATGSGTVELAIPKLQEGTWIGGVSTRRVDALVKALGNEAGFSRSSVSRICKDIDEYVGVFLTDSLAGAEYVEIAGMLQAAEADLTAFPDMRSSTGASCGPTTPSSG